MVLASQQSLNRFLLFSLFVILLSSPSIASVSFVDPTMSDNTLSSNTSIIINATITDAALREVMYVWNGSNFTFYNNSISLMFNFDTYTQLNDTSKFHRNASYMGDAAYTASGKYNGAVAFDGNGDYIQLNTTTGIPVGNDLYTISAWINPTICNGGYGIVGWGSYGSSNQANAFRLATGCFILNYWWANDITSTGTVAINQWNHVVATFNGSTRSLYINGRLDKSDTPSGHNVVVVDPVTIGKTYSNEYFNGTIDEVRIWNCSFNSTEIYEQYVSNLRQYDTDKWELLVNQSKNATAVLDNATYTYQIFTYNTTGSQSSTEQRSYTLGQIPITPEFGEWAMLLILITVISGFYGLKRHSE
ncbi:LamG domain-containing protein [Candidatus Woesearchaeota archaeon]|nr:LamG domain-containing protein [Candidatus Woesearchaeota archaeon]